MADLEIGQGPTSDMPSTSNHKIESTHEKPWKRKKKKFDAVGKVDEAIEIYEGKPAVANLSLDVTPINGGYIRVTCKDEAEFVVPMAVVECFQCVDIIFHSQETFKERVENLLKFPDIMPQVLEPVLRFCFMEYLNKLKAEKYWGHDVPRIAFQFEVEPEKVMDIIYVAHFLGINSLLNVAATMVAHHLRDVLDVSSMPTDLAQCVAEQFSAQELFEAEERADFLALNLDTTSLWEKHWRKIPGDSNITPVKLSSSYPSYDNWDAYEGPPPTSWKSLYIAVTLQQLADKQDGGSNDLFFAEVSKKGKYAYNHTIRPVQWDWTMVGHEGLSFTLYLAQFPNLLSLNLTKLPLGKPLEDGSLPCCRIGQVLECLPLLQQLDISDSGFTTDAAVLLSIAIQNHQRLQVLRLSYNSIKTAGYAAISRALQYTRVLKMLDIRENGIKISMDVDAMLALKSSAVEVLLFDGNCKHNGEMNDSECQESSQLGRTHANNQQELNILGFLPSLIRHLQLQQCNLSDEHMEILCHGLTDNSSIQMIDLGDNKITSTGATRILTWLQTNACLLELCLANNNITDSCSDCLCLTLSIQPSLEKLSLKGNFSYGEDNIQEVITVSSHRGDSLARGSNKKFFLDLRGTDVSYGSRARIQRQAAGFSNLTLLI